MMERETFIFLLIIGFMVLRKTVDKWDAGREGRELRRRMRAYHNNQRVDG